VTEKELKVAIYPSFCPEKGVPEVVPGLESGSRGGFPEWFSCTPLHENRPPQGGFDGVLIGKGVPEGLSEGCFCRTTISTRVVLSMVAACFLP